MRPDAAADRDAIRGRVVGPPAQVGLVAVEAFSYWSLNGLGMLQPSNLASLTIGWLPPLFVTLWAGDDARRTHYWPAFHYGLAMFAVSFIFVPHYVFHTRGWRGLPLMFGLLLAVFSPTLGWIAGLLFGVTAGVYSPEEGAWALANTFSVRSWR